MGAGSSRKLRSIIWAAIVAGIVSTIAQMGLWWLAGEQVATLLLRDARLTAALLLGHKVLPPPADFDLAVMLVASLIHFSLSLLYAALLFPFRRAPLVTAFLIGSAFGAVLYALNLHGFTLLFPWFVEARGAITLVAHLVFGVTAMETLRRT